MSEDHLLRILGRLAREENDVESARLDDRWDRLAAGTLTREEEAELRALAETSPEAREAYEAFRPLDAGFQTRVVDALRSELTSGAAAPEDEKTPARPLLFRRRGVQIGWLTAAGLAAASLLLFLRGPSQLPVYTVEPSRGDQAFRGSTGPSGEVPLFAPGSMLTILGIPAEPPGRAQEVDARVYFARDGELIPWQPAPAPEIDEKTGRLRLRGAVSPLAPGPWKVWLVVGRPGDIPPPDELARELRAGRTGQRGWQASSAEVRIAPSPP